VTGPEIARLAETILGCVTGLSLVVALIAREAIKQGWVRLTISFGVIPLEKRGQAPQAAAPKVIPGTVVHETGRAA
jgi:hypothetical protein